jgi:hypothetical protein
MKIWLIKHKITENFIFYLLLAFFIFQSLFISIRILLIGSNGSTNIYEFIISSLPEFFALIIFSLVMLNRIGNVGRLTLSLFDKILLAFVFSNIILGTLLAGNLILSLYAIRMSYFPMIFYFIAKFGITKDSVQIENYTSKLINWYFIVGISGLILYFFFPDVIKYMTLKTLKPGAIEAEYYIKRMGSVFWTPVVFASFMAVCTIYFYYKSIQKQSFWNYSIYSLMWCCLFLTVSRGAIISFFFGWILLTIMYRSYMVFLKSLGLMVFVLIVLWIIDPLIYNVLLFIASSSAETLMIKKGLSRVDLWLAAFDDFIKNPIGYGLGKAGHVAVRFFGKFSPDAATYSTDGWYLKLANETGVWGLLSYFTLTGVFFVQSIKYIRKIKQSFFDFLFIIFLMVAAQNVVSNVNDFYSFSCLFWLFIGLSQNLIDSTCLKK